jgi:lipoprotein-releasing system permease protein
MQRNLFGPALGAAVIAITLGLAAGAVGLFAFGEPPETLWPLVFTTLAGCVVAGLAAHFFSGRLAFPELLVATMIVAGGAVLYGAFGMLLAPAPALPLGEMGRLAPGPMYIGATWVRDILALLFVGLLQAVTASSLVYMARSRGGGYERFVGMRYLAAKRRDARVSRTALVAALGVSLGVAALITVISAMSGYQAEVKDKILTTNTHLIVQRFGNTFDKYDDAQQKILEVPGVVASSPFVFTGGMLAAERGMFPVLVKGIDVDLVGGVTRLREQLKSGDLPALRPSGNGMPGLFVGKELFAQLGLKLGDVIALVSPVPSDGRRGGPPKRMLFRLVGMFSSGMNEFDQKLVYVELSAAQRFVGEDNGITGLEVRTTNPDTVEVTAQRVVQKLGGFPYRTIDWRQLNSGIFSALSMQKMLMVVILIFIIVVAAFNIASTLFMLVVEKTREVAVLKAMGARDGSVMKIFVIEGHMISLVGIAFGVVLGLVLCFLLGRLRIHIAADVYLVDTLRVLVQPSEVVLIALGALEVAHLATLYPALRAARTLPVEAMRYG